MTRRNTAKGGRGFTLIELLVVIAIIAILAAILFPVFAQAREKARQTQCTSNAKQMATAIQMYKQDFDETYPQAYYYANDNSGSGGYVQWSGLIQPYTKNFGMFVCPSDPLKGHVPTNPFDVQVPRLSYTANGAVLARKRRTADPGRVVIDSEINGAADTIIIAEATSSVNCMNDVSNASGTNNKSHRSTNAVMLAGGSTRFTGETEAQGTPLEALTYQKAVADLNVCPTATSNGLSFICYTQPDRHSFGSMYVFADGHAKWMKLEQTLNPNNYLWGKKFYAHNSPIYKPGTTIPVQ